MEKIREVNVKSLEFHLYRRDFEKWAAQTLEDEELAKRFQELEKHHLSTDKLQEELYLVVQSRFKDLKSKACS